jgi:hypothetical protein
VFEKNDSTVVVKDPLDLLKRSWAFGMEQSVQVITPVSIVASGSGTGSSADCRRNST